MTKPSFDIDSKTRNFYKLSLFCSFVANSLRIISNSVYWLDC